LAGFLPFMRAMSLRASSKGHALAAKAKSWVISLDMENLNIAVSQRGKTLEAAMALGQCAGAISSI
jgi:hypothetical protein